MRLVKVIGYYKSLEEPMLQQILYTIFKNIEIFLESKGLIKIIGKVSID